MSGRSIYKCFDQESWATRNRGFSRVQAQVDEGRKGFKGFKGGHTEAEQDFGHVCIRLGMEQAGSAPHLRKWAVQNGLSSRS